MIDRRRNKPHLSELPALSIDFIITLAFHKSGLSALYILRKNSWLSTQKRKEPGPNALYKLSSFQRIQLLNPKRAPLLARLIPFFSPQDHFYSQSALLAISHLYLAHLCRSAHIPFEPTLSLFQSCLGL